MKRIVCLLIFLCSVGWTKNVTVKWAPIRGAFKYELHIKLEEEIVVREEIEGQKSSWTGEMPAGVYTYLIRGIDRMQQPGKWSALYSFVVTPESPKMVSPAANAQLAPDANGNVTFKWKPVDGAARYSIEIKSSNKTIKSDTTEKSQYSLPAPALGSYTWQVRAMIEMTGKAPKSVKVRKAEGPYSRASAFTIVQSTEPREVASAGDAASSVTETVAVGRNITTLEAYSVVAPYSYRVTSPSSGNEGTSSSLLIGLVARLNYRLDEAWSAEFDLRDSFFKINNKSVDRKEVTVAANYLTTFEDFIVPIQLGVHGREYFGLIRPTIDTDPPGMTEFVTVGPIFGIQVIQPITSTIALGGAGDFYYPLAAFGGPKGMALSSRGANFSLGAVVFLELSAEMTLKADLRYFNSPIQFILSGQPSAEQTRLSGVRTLIGLQYAM